MWGPCMEHKIVAFVANSGYGYGSGSGDGSGYGYGSGDGSGDGYGDGSGYGYGYGYGSGDGYGYGDGYGDGYGSGDGSGYGSGDGSGDGYGDGSGYGYGDGSGSGSGDGSGYGDGSGDGYGDGSGSGSGDGSGDGSGSGSLVLLQIRGKPVYYIDEVPTVITAVNGYYAKGFIVTSIFTLRPCFVAKYVDEYICIFAHGKTLKDAVKALEKKKERSIPVEQKIELVCKKYKVDQKFTGKFFYDLHHYLTGSCDMGRKTFFEDHNLSLDKLYTFKDFIVLTENAYNGKIIKLLKEKMLGENR